MTRRKGVRLRDDIACREVAGEWYVLTADNAFHAITDPVGALVMKTISKKPGVTQSRIAGIVKRRFDTGGEDVETDIETFVSDLIAKGIVEETSGVTRVESSGGRHEKA